MQVFVIVLAIAAGCATCIVALHAAQRNPLIGVLWFGLNCALDVVLAALLAVEGEWGIAAWMGFLALVNAWMCRDYWHRRRRKRAPRAYGAKSRALLAELVRKAREAARPRRVLRPVPGSAV